MCIVKNFLHWISLCAYSKLNICKLQEGHGKNVLMVLESPGLFSVKVWKFCMMLLWTFRYLCVQILNEWAGPNDVYSIDEAVQGLENLTDILG